MAKIIKGKDIKCVEDIHKMIAYLCITENNFTKNDLYLLSKKNMEGSKLRVDLKLKVVIDKTLEFLLSKNLIEQNGDVFNHVGVGKSL